MPRKPTEDTKASQALRAALTPKMTQEQLAAQLDVTQQAISSWANGRTSPSPEVMAKLEDILQIPMRDWASKLDEEAAPQATGTEGH